MESYFSAVLQAVMEHVACSTAGIEKVDARWTLRPFRELILIEACLEMNPFDIIQKDAQDRVEASWCYEYLLLCVKRWIVFHSSNLTS